MGAGLTLDRMMESAPECVRRPTKAEVLDILQDRSVYVPWGIYAEDVGNIQHVVLLDDRVLTQILPEGRDVEVHICCKLRDRANVRKVLLQAIMWIKGCGARAIYTTAPEDRAALKLMLQKLGFQELGKRWVLWDSIQ